MKLGQREGVGTRLGQRGRIALLCLSLSLVPGALRCASAAAAEWQPIGAAGDWANVVGALAVHGLDRDGTLSRAGAAGPWKQVGESREFHDVRFIFFIDGALYLVRGGTLYKRKI